MNTDTPYNCLYSLIMAVWSTIFVEVWKRREHEISHIWRMANFENHMQQVDRPDFKAELVIDHKSRSAKKMNITNPYVRRLTDELPAVLLGIAAVVGCFIGYRSYRTQFKDTANSVGSSLVNAGVIVVLGTIY